MDVGTTIGIGAAITIVVAVVKMVAPTLPGRYVPAIVLVLAAVLVLLQAASTHALNSGAAFTLVLQIVAQTATALGLREGTIAIVPAAARIGPSSGS